jgi:hypothetical protein
MDFELVLRPPIETTAVTGDMEYYLRVCRTALPSRHSRVNTLEHDSQSQKCSTECDPLPLGWRR